MSPRNKAVTLDDAKPSLSFGRPARRVSRHPRRPNQTRQQQVYTIAASSATPNIPAAPDAGRNRLAVGRLDRLRSGSAGSGTHPAHRRCCRAPFHQKSHRNALGKVLDVGHDADRPTPGTELFDRRGHQLQRLGVETAEASSRNIASSGAAPSAANSTTWSARESARANEARKVSPPERVRAERGSSAFR